MKICTQLSDFLKDHKLNANYLEHAQQWFSPVVQAIKEHQNSAKTLIMVGINGCQGSGKSTLADYLATQLRSQHQLNVAVLSLDDFYYSTVKRNDLAQNIHPLLATRGVPGTHNLPLALKVLKQLKNSTANSAIALPRFDKKTDEPLPTEQWPVITGKVDVILFEGWCFGVQAQKENELLKAINHLETQDDPNALWRSYVNKQLQQHDKTLYQEVGLWLMLKAPSFQVVKTWRLEQEQKLAQSNRGDLTQNKIMSEAQITRFISYFQRLTEHGLATLPKHCHFVYHLDENRNITQVEQTLPKTKLSRKDALIYTDLDGTLLDHDTYSFAAALPVLTELSSNNIPVIPNTSKTAAELLVLRQQLQLDGPFIVENGAAIYLPKSQFPHCPKQCFEEGEFWVKAFVYDRKHWLTCIDKALEHLPSDFKQAFTAMSTMSTQDIIDATGLNKEAAVLAAQRGYGEPLLWQGLSDNTKDDASNKAELIKQLTLQGATVLEGGRFIHVCGQSNKGKAMIWLSALYQQLKSISPCNIALGDGKNDINMLEAADIAVVIKSPAHEFPSLNKNVNCSKQVLHTKGCGPTGWAESLTQLFNFNLSI